MYQVSICVRPGYTPDTRRVTLADESRDPLNVTCSLVPNGDGGEWWELDAEARWSLAGVDGTRPVVASCVS